MKKSKLSSELLVVSILALSLSCSDNDLKQGEESINPKDMESYIRNLASDEFMGRKPFTPGEKKTVDYLAEQLKRIGYEPAFGGSYFQEVPMTEIKSEVSGKTIIENGKIKIALSAPDDIAVTSPRTSEEVNIRESEMVFAGFGISAPDQNWDDFRDLDVKGKTIVVLINDPGLYTNDSTLFKGREMTYYGRWTYKFEEAARQGAEGILIIHETEGAGYQYTIPRKSAISPKLYMQTADSNRAMCSFTGWLSAAAADTLFAGEGFKVEDLRKAACKRDFRGFKLKSRISLSIKNSLSFNTSTNVAGVLRGTSRADECIVFSAHWDHFGIGEKENGDSIYNGAVDNGTSMAWAFEIGEAFTKLRKKPERSVVLFFPTAEEQGLLGSSYYTEMIKEAAERQDRYIIPDPNSHTGMFYRSDHFPFASKGVPSAFVRGNLDNREHGKEWAAKMERDYIDNKYHRPSDNFEPDTWNLEGIAEDARLVFYAGYRLATTDYFPQWKKSSEFHR
ncbi:MAG: M28 family peptidase [Bacteroidia bacterium]|nr:M28 family peptidase [Bacteroidia bacterium]